ncbi:restriction endonuclease subunit S [Microbacterium sp. No. 7]|uniref:restriction endonuclease subunit S n=1 Tax=Microbacterium sp. No. 7 TaxID=1714373 RepID=UPI00300BF6C2
MRNGWEKTTLGTFLSEITRPVMVADLTEVRYAGVRWYTEGVYVREVVPASEVKTKTLTILRRGDVTYNRMWATKASFGVAGEGVDGCHVTNDFPIFEVDTSKAERTYVELLFDTSEFQAEAAGRATGTTERRRLKQRDFLAIPITLPPLDEQRRIVDLIAAIDDAVDAAGVEMDAALAAKMSIADGVEGDATPLGELLTDIVAGASPSALLRPPRDDEVGVLKVSAIGDERFHEEESKALESSIRMPERARVRTGDLLMTRASGAIARVGVTCVVQSTAGNLFLSDKTFRLMPDTDKTTGEWLNTMLKTRAARAQIEALATGSDMRNLAQARVRMISLPVPELGDQGLQAGAFAELSRAADTARATAEALRSLRSNLLTVLLSGEHEIPSSYDTLLGEVA